MVFNGTGFTPDDVMAVCHNYGFRDVSVPLDREDTDTISFRNCGNGSHFLIVYGYGRVCTIDMRKAQTDQIGIALGQDTATVSTNHLRVPSNEDSPQTAFGQGPPWNFVVAQINGEVAAKSSDGDNPEVVCGPRMK
jgi:hypothetical protein